MKRGSTVQYLYKRAGTNSSNIGVVAVKSKYKTVVRFSDGTISYIKLSSLRLLVA